MHKGLTTTEAKALKDYFQGKLTPTVAATKFIENMDMEPVWNPSLQRYLQYLVAMAWAGRSRSSTSW